VADEAGGAQTPRWGYRLVAHSRADPESLWPLIAEVERWKQWSFLTRTFLLRPGAPDPNGVGALRRLAVGPFGSTEEVVAFEPPRHLAYEARKGMPARHYRADVVLEEEPSGTRIEWSGALDPLPGTGPLAVAYARGFVSSFLRAVVRYAERAVPG
jgi:hypothetical protein